MSSKPKFEALVANAIRKLHATQGSTPNEIANFLSEEYDVSGTSVRKQIQQTIRKGVNYGIFQRLKRGYITCDRNVPDHVEPHAVNDCNSCRRARRGNRVRPLNFGRKKKTQRMSSRRANFGKQNRSRRTVRKSRTGRQTKQKIPRQFSSSEKAKSKNQTNNPSGDNSAAARIARKNSRSPAADRDESQET